LIQLWFDAGMSETQTKKTKATRVPGDVLFGVGGVLAIVALLLFFVGQSPFSMVLILGGLLLAILGKLQTIAWNTSPDRKQDGL
jgi:uncharacterized membrane protein